MIIRKGMKYRLEPSTSQRADMVMFASMLEYKQLWNGGFVEYVPAAYISQRCSACGYIAKDNRVSQSKFKCLQCDHAENADFNAAKNILEAGHVALACGVDAMASTMKQEPLAV